MTRHKHADLIIAWANGAEIEVYDELDKTWTLVHRNDPNWCGDKYRIKPEKVEIYKYFAKEGGSIFHADVGTPNLILTWEDDKLVKAEVV